MFQKKSSNGAWAPCGLLVAWQRRFLQARKEKSAGGQADCKPVSRCCFSESANTSWQESDDCFPDVLDAMFSGAACARIYWVKAISFTNDDAGQALTYGSGICLWCSLRKSTANGRQWQNPGLGDRILAFFNLGVVKLLDLATVEADQMVVVAGLH